MEFSNLNAKINGLFLSSSAQRQTTKRSSFFEDFFEIVAQFCSLPIMRLDLQVLMECGRKYFFTMDGVSLFLPGVMKSGTSSCLIEKEGRKSIYPSPFMCTNVKSFLRPNFLIFKRQRSMTETFFDELNSFLWMYSVLSQVQERPLHVKL